MSECCDHSLIIASVLEHLNGPRIRPFNMGLIRISDYACFYTIYSYGRTVILWIPYSLPSITFKSSERQAQMCKINYLIDSGIACVVFKVRCLVLQLLVLYHAK